jgi:hypothetical protein
MKKLLLTVFIIFGLFSCNTLRDYLTRPDTKGLSETINSVRLTGYAATLAMSAINGYTAENMLIRRSNQGFPCTALIEIDLDGYEDSRAEDLVIAGMWADENTAVLSLIFTDFHYGTNTFNLVGIETIPVLKEGDYVHVVCANQEVRLNPDQNAILSIDLDDLEFQSELIRIDLPRPDDVYIAVTQCAYFIDVNTHGTPNNSEDDSYNISGGGQFIEVENNSVEIAQQAVVDVFISPSCQTNPQSGMALLRTTGVEDDGFPELGTAVFEFYDNCSGKANVFLATGIYVSVNGQKVSFVL